MYMLSSVDATTQAFLFRAKPDPIILHSYIMQWIPRVLFIWKTLGFFSSAEVLMPSTADIQIG